MKVADEERTPPPRQLAVLMVAEDPAEDGILERHFAASGYLATIDCVSSPVAMRAALANRDYHAVIADYGVPELDAMRALDLLRESGRDIPFIVFSETISDEMAVAAMRAGAHDYVLKSNIGRLLPAIERGRQEVQGNRQRLLLKAAREEAAQSSRQREEELRSIYDHAAIGIQHISIEGRLRMVNPALENLLGYTRDELLAKTTEELTHPADRKPESLLLHSLFRGEREFYAMEKRYIHKDGSLRWVSVTSSLVKDAAGRAVSRATLVHDIAERKRAELLEEQLQQSQKLEILGQLAGSIAHDFNNLLSVMLGYAELLFEELPPADPRRTRVEQIEASVKSGAQLTGQLLAFSRKQPVIPQVIDLTKVVAEVQPMVALLLPPDIQVVVHCPPEVCPVWADSGRIQQVVLNLVTNARDAMQKKGGGRLVIDVSTLDLDEEYVQKHVPLAAGRYQMLAVSDTGHGMDTETLGHLFEPFFTTKERGKGTGLGLSTAYGIVKQFGGDICVDSKPGKGSVFKVYLPVANDPVHPVPVAPPVPQKLSGNETILLAEDSAPLRQLARELLLMNGYSVLEAADGVEALELSRVHEGQIDLLLTDIVMPRMRGTELAQYIAEQRPKTAIVFLSGFSEEVRLHVHSTSPVAIVQKPYTVNALLQTVRQALDGKQPEAS
jgi:hypothetical protein